MDKKHCIIMHLKKSVCENVEEFKTLLAEHEATYKELMDIWLEAGGFLKCLKIGIFEEDEKIKFFLEDLKEIKYEYILEEGCLTPNARNLLHDEFNTILLKSLLKGE